MDPRLYEQLREIERSHWWFRGRRQVLLAALERLDIRAERVLDCGCGAGSNLDVLASRLPDARILGIDVEKDPLEFCHAQRTMPVAQADASSLPFEDDSFDLVAALDTIEHVEDDSLALSELHRVCRPGGTLFLTVPAFESLWGNIDEVSHHFRRYRRAPLLERVRAAGFEVRLVRYFNSFLFPPIAAVRLGTRLARRLRGVRPVSGQETLRSDFDLVKDGPLNELLAHVLGAERHLLGQRLPFGVSLLLVGRRVA